MGADSKTDLTTLLGDAGCMAEQIGGIVALVSRQHERGNTLEQDELLSLYAAESLLRTLRRLISQAEGAALALANGEGR